ncbi:MAG: M48 family metalloprotease [Pseudomonadota bacterium]
MTALHRGLRTFVIILLAWTLPFAQGQAQGISLLSDAETEWFIRQMMAPILEQANIDPRSVNYYIVNDDNLNAFVAAGQNIFVHTGLFTQTKNVGQVVGVLAHETGHISGAHLARRGDAAGAPTAITLASMLLGVAAIAAGAADAGIGIIAGGQQAATRSFFSFTRVQEASADQAAARFLEGAELSGRGLLETFRQFASQEYRIGIPQDPYVRTHPLSGDRVANLERAVTTSQYYEKKMPAEWLYYYDRVVGKIEGFQMPFDAVLRKYPPSDTSEKARYARAYAYHKAVEIEKSKAEIETLLALRPGDPYYLELKGQLMFENGDVEASLVPLRLASAAAPDESQILTLLGRALIATDKPEYLTEAVKTLELSTFLDGTNPFTWYQLSIAYNQSGYKGEAGLAAAERYALIGQFGPAVQNARKAVEKLEPGTPKWLRAQDLLFLAAQSAERSKRR